MASLNDRVEGVLLGTAAGDALGAPYEFQPPRGPELPVEMAGGGPWEPSEWTDDTAMAIAIAEVAATGADLRESTAQDAIVARWHEWSLGAKDVGIQTRSVLATAAREGRISAAHARTAAATLHERTGRTAGNGSLMRTAPVALAYLDDEHALVAAARAISELTHFDPDAGDATVLWCCAIRHAVLTTELDVRIGLRHIGGDRREVWSTRIEQAEVSRPSDFANNGWVVAALQAAWSAIATTVAGPGTDRAEHLRRGLDAAVRAGNDTDTVAAIAGGLLGAAYGASAVPLEWRHLLHGWPDLTARGLVGLATAIHRKGRPAKGPTYPGSRINTLTPHPYDPDVLLGGVGALRRLPAEVDAVVSLCRVADADVPAGMPHVEVRLIDKTDPDENPHLDFVLLDTVRAIETLRAQGRTVLVHCAEAYSRTPTTAALYGARLRAVGADEALRDVLAALPNANPNPAFREALQRLGEALQSPPQPADAGRRDA
ncbi:ADP-ribosylglycohydrolase family protein [[Mycobacterium] burgundiense]|uniref:ADP-ribosylglycohydrolase family protein n=1 Tax=[Mycobacterium] burgundiense TaxID=3064286 RepID=A0ABM9LLZ3_9MYCO|nr:ADP-ribosylglycohydrolase family protein [Mycolicibacterium sp. MU0053]CAJ1501247.1 ADP-ribosylglycohydrolase family protein [Mycolicibacterium sp. MU0053]